MLEKEFVTKINNINGKAYVVGGWVRDYIRGVIAKDKDYVITGVLEDDFTELFPQAIKVGKSFPVYLLELNGESCEIAFARQEREFGVDSAGFNEADAFVAKNISIEADLYRRDTTMNSMAIDLETGALIDPFLGKEHIKIGKILPTSHHFMNDPIRALRVARQAAQFGFAIEKETISAMKECRAGLMLEAKERLFNELAKALQANKPSVFFVALKLADLLDITYPQIHALIGQTQPALYHPEGDAFNHTMEVVDQVAQRSSRVEVRFAALAHDLGKGLTPKEKLPTHHMHDILGLDAIKAFAEHITLPNKWIVCAEFAIQHHMRVNQLKQRGKIVDFMVELAKNSIGEQGFSDIVFADKGSIPDCLINFATYITAIGQVKGNDAPSELKGKEIGAWIRQQQIKMYGEQKRLLRNNEKSS